MHISLDPKVAIVTGASSGIGTAIARQLVECGARIVITGRRQDTIEQAAERIGPDCLGLAADVSNRADMERLVAIVRERFGRLDVVVANAAVGANARLGEITEEKLSKVIGTNLLGVVHTVQAALPLMSPAVR